MERPDIVLLTIDTLRPDALGAYGSHPSMTPGLDRLAKSGIRFDQAIASGSWTQAAFPPLMTSTYAAMYGGCLGPLGAHRPSPVSVLRENGYHTAAFSTNPLLGRDYAYDRGFDDFLELAPSGQDPWLRKIKGGQWLLRSRVFHRIACFLGASFKPSRVYVSASQLTEMVAQWIQAVKSPFFVWLHYMDTHWPYHVEESLQTPAEVAGLWKDLSDFHHKAGRRDTLAPREKCHYLALYRAATRHLDTHIGRLLALLEQSDRWRNTVVVVVADHGEEFLEHGRWGHWENNLYDEILRVPLIIKPPGGGSARVVSRQVGAIDIMPTILDICQCCPPPRMEGTSLKPLWETTDHVVWEERPIIAEMWRDNWHRVAIRTGRHKYIWDSKHPDRVELFDLRSDPGEEINLIEHLPALARSFQDQVDRHLDQVGGGDRKDNAPPPQPSDEITRRLRAMGYVE